MPETVKGRHPILKAGRSGDPNVPKRAGGHGGRGPITNDGSDARDPKPTTSVGGRSETPGSVTGRAADNIDGLTTLGRLCRTPGLNGDR